MRGRGRSNDTGIVPEDKVSGLEIHRVWVENRKIKGPYNREDQVVYQHI